MSYTHFGAINLRRMLITMRIMMVVPGGVDRSGQQRVIPALLWLIERLAQRHELIVVATQQSEELSSYKLLGAQVVCLGHGRRSSERNLPRWLKAMHALRQQYGKPDVLHAFWATETGTLAGLCGRLWRVPVLLSIGGGELVWIPRIQYGLQGKLRTRLAVWLSLLNAQQITGGSHYVLAQLPHGRKGVWLPLGVDTAYFQADYRPLPQPPWRLLHVGSINRVKAPELLLHTMAKIQAAEPRAHLDWAGEDTRNGKVQAVAKALKLNITFHRFMPNRQLLSLYSQAHLYIQSSWHESQGVAVCEAAASGVPLVGTAVGLIKELAPTAAVAVPVGEAAPLAAAVLRLLETPAELRRLGEAAHAWAHTYDADWTAAQFEGLYHQLIA